jgi:hypothetical protein
VKTAVPTPGPVTPAFFSPAPVDRAGKPQIHVIVDTEEEFNWSKPFSRDQVGVTAIDEVDRLQAVLAPYKVKPTYVIDYPVASTASSAERLAGFARAGACEIGAHLHPWVSPPYTEEVGLRTSYACNLGFELERDKIARLTDAIGQNLGVTARVYKAGRYGFGRTTAAVLEELGFDVDVSVNPHMDYRSDGGPSFEGFVPQPSSFGARRRLLEVPCTTAFIGAVRGAGPWLHRAASAKWLQPVRAVGILAKSGMLNKVMLSPETSTYDEMRALTDTLYRDGVRTFSFTFHSPSLKPGCTPYVHTVAERDAFLKTIDRYCNYFLGQLGGVPGTPSQLYDSLREGQSI